MKLIQATDNQVEKILFYLHKNKLKQPDFAKECGFSNSSLKNILAGKPVKKEILENVLLAINYEESDNTITYIPIEERISILETKMKEVEKKINYLHQEQPLKAAEPETKYKK